MADRMRNFFKGEVLTYSYILIYIALSSGQIFFNKWVLSSKEINFPYPLGLTLLHMVFSSVLCFLFTKVFKIFKLEDGMTAEIYVSSVMPIGAMFAMTLWLGNTAYLHISVAFAQMLKAIMPVAVFILGVAAGLEAMSCKMLLIMSVISFGVLVASYGEMNINWIGVVYQMGGVVGEALRLIFMEILVKRKGLKLNPITLMYYVSPCSALCLFVPWLFLEKPKMDERSWSFQPLVLTLNSLCTFALNLSVFLVISHTSALTIRVAGVVKDWVVVLLSALLFADTKLTLINLFGYAIAIVGVAWYNNQKLVREVTRASPDESEEAQTIMMASSSTTNSPKRKREVEVSCALLPKDAQSRSRWEELKQGLKKEASLFLRSCGWSEDVYSFMRSNKKLCAPEEGNDASNIDEHKRLLIADAKPTFIPKILEALKANLIKRLN